MEWSCVPNLGLWVAAASFAVTVSGSSKLGAISHYHSLNYTDHQCIHLHIEDASMTALLQRADQAVSATAMVRNFSARLRDVSSGDVSHLVIFKDNEPTAVLMSIDHFQRLQDQIEDLSSELLAIQRIGTLDDSAPVSLEDMEERFG